MNWPTKPGLRLKNWEISRQRASWSSRVEPGRAELVHSGHPYYGEKMFLSDIEKIKSFQDIALTKNSCMTVKTTSLLKDRGVLLRVTRNNLQERQNFFNKKIQTLRNRMRPNPSKSLIWGPRYYDYGKRHKSIRYQSRLMTAISHGSEFVSVVPKGKWLLL